MVVDLATAPEVTAEVAAPQPPLRFRAARVLLGVLLAAVVTVVVAGAYDDTANALVAGHLRLLIATLLAGLLAVVALRAPLRRPAAADTAELQDEDPAAWEPEAIEPKAIVAGTHAAGRGGEPSDEASPVPGPSEAGISPQALLLQVRSLEATLAEEDLRLGRVRREAAKDAEDQVNREQRRVRVTMRVMRALVADQTGDAAVARMETALDRLATDSRFARPQLSPPASGTWPVAFAPPVPLASLTVPAVAAATGPADVVDPASAVTVGPAGGDGALTAPTELDDVPEPAAPTEPAGLARVLPVPPPPAPLVPARKGRRARRAAGV